ncbi:MAG: TIGR03936 family radical SAM-associated protein, partial [candidate division Zixibacteria bacterium]|nr:TIGR03936 family radical SAM-associated protein [candidate division Zixibacteria bacterium]
ADERVENGPLIVAGGPAVYNPEPLVPFVDVFFVGDGEEGLPEMLGILHDMRGESRAAKLEALVRRVESVYVPRFYDNDARPTTDFAPEAIKARLIPELKPEYYPSQPILPLVETVHNHLGVEIMRGCPRGCKFCFAAPIYKPVRPRPVNDIARQVEEQVRNTGYDEVSLLSLSATDYPDLEELVARLSRRLEAQRVSLSLPSLRPGSITPTLLDCLKRVRRGNLTIAPEAGSERLRLLIRKDFPDAAVFDTVRLAVTRGWSTIKLYFMVGLPTETEDDLQAIADLCMSVRDVAREHTRKFAIHVALSPFVPKAHTPFQWDETVPEEEVYRRIQFVKRQVRGGQITVRHNSTQTAMLASLLGRGGRQVAPAIESAYRRGCRFDAWGEEFNYDTWLEAFAEHGIDPAHSLKAIPFSERLPWSHIAKGPSMDHLIKQRQDSSAQLRDYVPKYCQEEAAEEISALAFGRGKKKVASRAAVAPTKNRVRLLWSKTAPYKYMSHLENLHTMERGLRRANWPVQYSQGFNPIMRLSLGPPLPLGFTSQCELIDITLESNLMPYMIDALNSTLPDGVAILDARPIMGKSKSLNALLNRVEYSLPTSLWNDSAALAEQTERLLQAATLECERTGKRGIKTIDIKPAVHDVRIESGQVVMVLGLGDGGYARATEVAGFLTDSLTMPVVALPFHRLDMYRVDETGERTGAMDL